MKACEICEESSNSVEFDNDIRMIVCDDCIVELQSFIDLVGEFEEC